MSQNSSSSTKIPRRFLLPIRLVWIIITVFYVTIYLIAQTGEISRDKEFTVKGFSGQAWTPAQVESSAKELGIPIETLKNLANSLEIFNLSSMLYIIVGFLIFIKKPNDWVAVSISLSFMMFTNRTDILANHLPVFGFISELTDSLNSALLFVAFMIFPDGRFTPRWIRWIAIFTVVVQLLRLFSPHVFGLYVPSLALTLLSIMYSQIYRYRRVASPAQQLQIKWVIFINGIGFGLLGLVFLSYAVFPQMTNPGPTGLAGFLIGNFIWTLFATLLPLSFAIAILRSRLWDIDVIIRKTLVYTLLTGLLGLTYFGVIALLQNLLTTTTGQLSPAIIVLTTLSIYALFNPLRRRLQDFIDRRFYRQKYDAEKALAGFAASARNQNDLANIASRLIDTVQDTVQPSSSSLWLQRADKPKASNE